MNIRDYLNNFSSYLFGDVYPQTCLAGAGDCSFGLESLAEKPVFQREELYIVRMGKGNSNSKTIKNSIIKYKLKGHSPIEIDFAQRSSMEAPVAFIKRLIGLDKRAAKEVLKEASRKGILF